MEPLSNLELDLLSTLDLLSPESQFKVPQGTIHRLIQTIHQLKEEVGKLQQQYEWYYNAYVQNGVRNAYNQSNNLAQAQQNADSLAYTKSCNTHY